MATALDPVGFVGAPRPARPARARRRALALTLAVVLALGGCRASGQLAADYYAWSAGTFVGNPASVVPFFGGLAVGFVVGLPLCLISWPLTALFYPPEDEDEYYVSSALFPAVLIGTSVGTVLGAVFYPFGHPFMPDDPAAASSPPERDEGDEAGGD